MSHIAATLQNCVAGMMDIFGVDILCMTVSEAIQRPTHASILELLFMIDVSSPQDWGIHFRCGVRGRGFPVWIPPTERAPLTCASPLGRMRRRWHRGS